MLCSSFRAGRITDNFGAVPGLTCGECVDSARVPRARHNMTNARPNQGTAPSAICAMATQRSLIVVITEENISNWNPALSLSHQAVDIVATRDATGPAWRATIVAPVMCAVTFNVVRKISGIVSIASRSPIPSTGTPAYASTGTITRIEPYATPGTLKLASIAVRATPHSVGPVTSIWYNRAMKSTPETCAITAPILNIDAASGR